MNRAILYALEGKKEKAEGLLQEAKNSGSVSIGQFAHLLIETILGNLDGAFDAHFRMAETHSWPFLIKKHPLLEHLWMDSRFIEFCRKAGTPT